MADFEKDLIPDRPACRSDQFRSESLWSNRTVPKVFAQTFSEHRDSRVVRPSRILSYEELEDEVRTVAAGLRAEEVEEGM